MHTQTQSMIKGVVMIISFSVVLVLLFVPMFQGHNAMEHMDNLFNSISKGSAYYIPRVSETVRTRVATPIDVTLTLADEQQVRAARIVERAGLSAGVTDNRLRIAGDLQQLLLAALEDADSMYNNDAEHLTGRYGYNERLVLFDWWSMLKSMEHELNRQKHFETAKLVLLVQNKAVETSYNYYGIQAENIRDKIGIVLLALVFYVLYTLWYGFGILYLFEGLGMQLGH